MSFSASAAAVCFIACHGGPADHFATFAKQLSTDVEAIEVYASGPALKKFEEHGIKIKGRLSIDEMSSEEQDQLAESIAKACSTASVIITDVGHVFDIKVHKALADHATHVPHLAYYDNPESYVPGGYSAIAAHVMLAANGVLFANSNLAKAPIFKEKGKEIEFGRLNKVGIGYYPTNQAEKIAQRRATDRMSMREKLFSRNALRDEGQKVLVYFGGNNEEYFSKAFPFFLELLKKGMQKSDFSKLVIVVQQHPGAKSQNTDGNMVSRWMDTHSKTEGQAPKMILSDLSSDDAQTIADGALYYQTSMGPQFVLAGIPTIQVGHETYQDILVRNELIPSVIDVDGFVQVIENLGPQQQASPKSVIFEGLGIKKNWLDTLKKTIKEYAKVVPKPSVSLCGFQMKKSHLPYYLVAGVIALIIFLATRFFIQQN